MLELVSQPNTDCALAAYHCPITFCFEQTELQLQSGVNSGVGFSVSQPNNGDSFSLSNQTFTFVDTSPIGANEVLIGSDATETAVNLLQAIQSHPFFFCNYVAGNFFAPTIILVQSLIAGLDSNFEFNSDIDAITFLPGSNQGLDEIYKENCFLNTKIVDIDTSSFLDISIDQPITIKDRIGTACLSIQQIFKDYPLLYTPPPDCTTNVPYLDENVLRKFDLNFWVQCTNSDTGCGLEYSKIIKVPDLQIVNAAFQVNNDEGFNPYCGNIQSLQEWMTCMPTQYEVCIDSCIDWRFYFDYEGAFNIDLYTLAIVTYSDGSTSTFDGSPITHVGSPSVYVFDTSPGNIPVSGGLNIQQIEWRLIADIDGLTEINISNPRTMVVSYKDLCCDCHINFMFTGPTGNNDTIVASCEITTSLSYENFTKCEPEKCGDNLSGIQELLNKETVTHSVIFYDVGEIGEEYIRKFYRSPNKYMIDPDDGKIYRVIPISTEYDIFTNGSKVNSLFEYKLSNAINVQTN